ncbi:MAG: type restriction enzyme subunit [Methanolobus sp.]|nr:type restriction enzyme subunit [Methanolobus sp.]
MTGEWKECKLGDIVSSNKESIGKNYPFQTILYLDTGSITRGKIDSFQEYELSKAPSRAKRLVKNNVIVYSTVRPIQRHYGFIVNPQENLVVSTGFAVIEVKEHLAAPLFIFYFLTSDEIVETLDVIAEASTSAYPSLKSSDIEALDLLLPPLPEQHAIASVLSSLDDKIDLLHRQNKTLEAMAETLFRQWFVEGADEEWNFVKLGDYVRTNIASIKKDSVLKTIRYLDTGSLTEGKIDGYQAFGIADAPSRARRIVKHNDILVSTVRPNQKHHGLLKNPAEDVIVSTGFCVITCDKIDPHFVYIFLTTNEMTEYLHSIAEGSTSTYPSLKPSDIEDLEFQLPPQKKLDAFSEYAANTWNKIEYNHTQIRTLEELRDTLLPKLMSGEVRVEYEDVG